MTEVAEQVSRRKKMSGSYPLPSSKQGLCWQVPRTTEAGRLSSTRRSAISWKLTRTTEPANKWG